ncbi:related to Protein transport protein Sec24C [Serendipita indica DSM 11827]|uniref:Related to Protein transport protein Sec24C n=1 Tax=Serendipita indica (strain DSM 11827) TaxID=1109443 RepID=G4T7J8_SERID|nr:related to Protein transport protein Sec24C [Serendipita indica DSM 11827]
MHRGRRPPPINPSAINNPIQQPPHSAGTPLQGLRTKLDPEQIPSTAAHFAEDEYRWTQESYITTGEQPVPLSASEYHAIDQGNSTPRYLRPTIYAIPSNADLQSMTHVPFGIHITPLAQQPLEEAPVPIIDFGEDVGTREDDSGNATSVGWKTTVAPPLYMTESPNARLELQRGTVDFLVPKAYWALAPPKRLIHSFVPVTVDSGVHEKKDTKQTSLLPSIGDAEREYRKPTAMHYVFAFDVSLESVQTGLLRSACDILIDLLYGAQSRGDSPEQGADRQTTLATQPWWSPESKIAIVTFDKELCFYDFSPTLDRPATLVVTDIEEVFSPMPASSSLFIDPSESRGLLLPFLSGLSDRYTNTVCAQAALGSSIAASLALLSQVGGKVLIFATCMPKLGFGMLTERENEKSIYTSESDSTLFIPREVSWKEMGEECVDCGVGVSMVLAPSRWADIGTIGIVPKLTGGDLYFHPKFDPERDFGVLYSQIRRFMDRETGYQATLKLRCTTGIHVDAYYGNGWERAGNIDLAAVDADKSLYASLNYVSALDNFSSLTLDSISSLVSSKGGPSSSHHRRITLGKQTQAYLQSALLYTTAAGERRVRVCNLSLPVVSLAGNVYRYGDYEGVVAAFAKTAIMQMIKRPLRDIRDSLTAQCAELLLHYRRYCAASSIASQLILPEGFTLLPVYVNCILKSRPLKGTPVMSDVRNVHAHQLSSKTVAEAGDAYDPTEQLYMDARPRIYLMDDGDTMFLWLGGDVHDSYWRDLFDVSSGHELSPVPKRLPELPNSFSTRVREVIAHLEHQTGSMRRFVIVRQNLDALEIDFANQLMEDTNNGAMSYLDYLCYVHRLISSSLDNGYSSITVGNSSARSIPW